MTFQEYGSSDKRTNYKTQKGLLLTETSESIFIGNSF